MKIKNWSKFQHFKDRRPPWVKLYRDLLDDMEWHLLDPAASKVLVSLWLIASEDENQDGTLPDIKTLSWRLRMSESELTSQINKLSHWLDHVDINPISTQYQDDMTEKRREEKETEVEKSPNRSPTGSRMAKDWTLPEDWKQWAEEARPELDILSIAEQFKDYWLAKPGKDGRKLDWEATWRNWIRNQNQSKAPKKEPEDWRKNPFFAGAI